MYIAISCQQLHQRDELCARTSESVTGNCPSQTGTADVHHNWLATITVVRKAYCASFISCNLCGMLADLCVCVCVGGGGGAGGVELWLVGCSRAGSGMYTAIFGVKYLPQPTENRFLVRGKQEDFFFFFFLYLQYRVYVSLNAAMNKAEKSVYVQDSVRQ